MRAAANRSPAVAVLACVLAAGLGGAAPTLAAPGSDDFAGAAPLLFSVPGGVDNTSYTTQGPREPAPAPPDCPELTHSAWWRIAGTGQQIALSTAGSSFNTVLAVFDQGDADPDASNRIACNDDDASATGTSAVAFATSRGRSYLVAVGGRELASESGSIVLTATATRPANDDRASAPALQTGVPAPASNVGASHELAEGLLCGSVASAATIWFRWSAPKAGDATFATSASFETAVAVYRADTVSAVGCAAGAAPRAAVKVDAGEYLVQVASKGDDFPGLAEGQITTTAQFTADPDADRDGVAPPADCNDANPAIRPGAVEIAGDGIDQDCSGADLVIDRDGDGFPTLRDCNDENARINPDAHEVAGNGIDENCDGVVARYRKLPSTIRSSLARFPLRFTGLSVHDVLAGSRIELRCRGKGCFERKVIRVRSYRRSRSLLRYVRSARPQRGAVIEIRVTKSRRTGVVRRITARTPPKLPRTQNLCLPFPADPPTRC
jgi:hypothetical protein